MLAGRRPVALNAACRGAERKYQHATAFGDVQRCRRGGLSEIFVGTGGFDVEMLKCGQRIKQTVAPPTRM